MAYIVPVPGSSAYMGEIEVKILAILIRGLLVQLEVSWIVGGDRKTAWIEGCELTKSTEIVEVGFKEY